MLDLNNMDRTQRRAVLSGVIKSFRSGDPNVALKSAHQDLPGFTGLLQQNLHKMSASAAFERSVIALMSVPAKPVVRTPRPQPAFGAGTVRCIGLESLKF
jgi:hypothetical protein